MHSNTHSPQLTLLTFLTSKRQMSLINIIGMLSSFYEEIKQSGMKDVTQYSLISFVLFLFYLIFLTIQS